MKSRRTKTMLLPALLALGFMACKPEESEVIVEPEGRLVKQVKESSAENWSPDFLYVFSYDAKGEVRQVKLQGCMGNEIRTEDRYDYERLNDRLTVSHQGGTSDTTGFTYSFELDESGRIRLDKSHAGTYPAFGIPDFEDWEYTYVGGYVASAWEGSDRRFEFVWEEGNLKMETWTQSEDISHVSAYEYLPEENKTNIDILSLVGASLGRPGSASPDTHAELFYFGGKKSRNLPFSYAVNGKLYYQYNYEYDSQGCPVKIECRDAEGTLRTTWEILY